MVVNVTITLNVTVAAAVAVGTAFSIPTLTFVDIAPLSFPVCALQKLLYRRQNIEETELE